MFQHHLQTIPSLTSPAQAFSCFCKVSSSTLRLFKYFVPFSWYDSYNFEGCSKTERTNEKLFCFCTKSDIILGNCIATLYQSTNNKNRMMKENLLKFLEFKCQSIFLPPYLIDIDNVLWWLKLEIPGIIRTNRSFFFALQIEISTIM